MLGESSQCEEIKEFSNQTSTQDPSQGYSFRNDQDSNHLQKLYQIKSQDETMDSLQRYETSKIIQSFQLQCEIVPQKPLFEQPAIIYETDISLQNSFLMKIESQSPANNQKAFHSFLQNHKQIIPKQITTSPISSSKKLMTSSNSHFRSTSHSPLQSQKLNISKPTTPKNTTPFKFTISGQPKSPEKNLIQMKRPNASFFDSTPVGQVQQLLHKLIYAKKRTKESPVQTLRPKQSQTSLRSKIEVSGRNLKKDPPRAEDNEQIENQKSEQLYKIFQIIDSDNDGLISPQKIELSSLSDEVLNYCLEMLYEIDQQRMEINFRQFSKMFEKYYQKQTKRFQQSFLVAKINK